MKVVIPLALVLLMAAYAQAWKPIPEPSSPEVATKQQWVTRNCPVGAKWDDALFAKRLGVSEKLPVTKRDARVFEAYYYPAAEMTLLRNKLKDTVATYGWGKAGDL